MKIPRVFVWIVMLIPWAVAISAAWWLLLLRFPPSGVSDFSFPLDGSSPWLDAFLPGQRTTAPGVQPDGWTGQRIFMDPVYASARLPGAFDRVGVTLEAKPVRQPLLEFGILRDPDTFAFEMRPLWSEALARGWSEASVDGLHGYVREGLPPEILKTAAMDHLLIWHATTTAPTRMDQPGLTQNFSISLRGRHDFYVVPIAGDIFFRFLMQDINRSRGGNAAILRLSLDDETLWTDAIGTSGRNDDRPNQVFEKTVSAHGLKPGVYRLSFVADDNVFIRKITTTARHWVIGPTVYFGDQVGYSTTTPSIVAWTNSRHITAETLHPEGLQTVSLGSAHVNVEKTHTSYPLDRKLDELNGDLSLALPKGDTRVTGDGYFALSPDALFLPNPRRLTDASDPEREGITAILTPYKAPEITADGWLRLHASFAIGQAETNLKFTLSAPGIVSRTGAVDVRAAEMRYERPALSWTEWWREVRRELTAAWHRI